MRPSRTEHTRVVALAAILTLQLMLALDSQVMTVALPTIRDDLGFTTAQLSWIPNGYAVAFGGLILLGGRLGDAFGRVRTFRWGTGLFVVASLVGGLAQDPATLVGARVIQGIGAAAAAPSVLALIATMARSQQERARGLAYFTATAAVGASLGLIVGGALTDLASWRWGLLINVPIGLAVMVVVGRLVKDGAARHSGGFDIPGALLATLGSVSLVWSFISAADHGWRSPATIGLLLAAAGLIASLVLVERRSRSPLIAVHLLTSRPRVGALINMGLISGVHLAMLFLIPQYLQRVLDLTPLQTGLAIVPMTTAIFIVTRWVPALVVRFGPRTPLLVGGVLMVGSFTLWAPLDESSNYVSVLIPLLVHALGVALIFTSGTIVAMDHVPDSDAGSGSGMLQMAQQLGGSLGIAIVVSAYATGAVDDQFVPGLRTALLTAGALAAVATLVAAATIGGRRRDDPANTIPAPISTSGTDRFTS